MPTTISRRARVTYSGLPDRFRLRGHRTEGARRDSCEPPFRKENKERTMRAYTSKVAMGVAALMLATGFAGEPALGMGERVPIEGMPAANFSLTDLDGRRHDLGQNRGKIVLLNFWATWCKPCTTEMPAMQAIYDRLRGKGFVVLAVNELEDDVKVREH